jgi:hypothetical protein
MSQLGRTLPLDLGTANGRIRREGVSRPVERKDRAGLCRGCAGSIKDELSVNPSQTVLVGAFLAGIDRRSVSLLHSLYVIRISINIDGYQRRKP